MSEGFDERDVRAARLNDEQVEHETSRDEPHRLGRFVILEHLGVASASPRGTQTSGASSSRLRAT